VSEVGDTIPVQYGARILPQGAELILDCLDFRYYSSLVTTGDPSADVVGDPVATPSGTRIGEGF